MAGPGTDGEGRSTLAKVVAWVLSLGLSAPLVITLSSFGCMVAALLSTLLAGGRLVAIGVCPARDRRRFPRDRPWRVALAVQGVATTAGVGMLVLAIGADDAVSRTAASIRFVCYAALVVVWAVSLASSRRYARPRGGLLAAFRAKEVMIEAINVPRRKRSRAADLTFLLGVAAYVVVGSGFAAFGVSTAAGYRAHARHTTTRGTSITPQPRTRSAPTADQLCGYNVYDRIAKDVPADIADALWTAYVGPGAPGADLTGCPTEGTLQTTSLYVTNLYDATDGSPKGVLVSTPAREATVVYPTLRDRLSQLLDQNHLTRVGQRMRSRVGDLQVFFLTEGECTISIRQYNYPYVTLPPRVTAAFVRAAVSHGKIPTVAKTTRADGGTRYTLTFGTRHRSEVHVDVDRRGTISVEPPTADANSSGTCPDTRPLYRLSYQSAPTAPDHTP